MASSVSRRVRWLALTLAASVLATGCVDDRSTQVAAPGRTCAAAAHVVEALQETRGAPSSEEPMQASFTDLADELVVEGDEADALALVEELQSLLPASEEPVSGGADDAWYGALTELDTRIAGLCGFSMRVLVASAERADAAADPDGLDELSLAGADDDGPLNWAAIRRRLPDAPWIHEGYTGIVGIGPGVYVTVAGVPTHAEARAVCTDVLGALAAEAEDGDVEVRVQGLGADVFAMSHNGACIGAS